MSAATVHPLRLLWTEAGFRTASAFADAAGISRRTLVTVERDGAIPSNGVLIKLAAVLSVDEVELYRQLRAHAEEQAKSAEASA